MRRALWFLLALAGMALSLAGAPMVTDFDGLDFAGLVFMVAGVLGFTWEVERA